MNTLSISTNSRRRIIVGGHTYIWYVAMYNNTPYNVLNIVSDDKYLILSCPLHTKAEYVINKGRIFKTKETSVHWKKNLLPFVIPYAFTPKFVEKLIVWTP